MSDDRSLLTQARQLIDEKRYDEAREILESMPHNETAQSWLQRLNQRAPSNHDAAPADKPKRSAPDIQFEGTIPMVPQVTSFIQDMLVSRIGILGSIALVVGIVFAITGAIDQAFIRENNMSEVNIVYVILLTVFTAVNFYVLCYMLSIAFPKFSRNQLLAVVAVPTIVALIAGFMEHALIFALSGSEDFLEWFLRIIMAGGIAYLFSSYNTRLGSEGAPRLQRDLTILFFIGFVMLSSTAATLNINTIVGDYITLVAGFFNGLIIGALTGMFSYIVLKQAE